jgi:tRNA(Ile)-lysidine synthase
VPVADDAAPVSAAEAKTLFAPLARHPAVVLAVSGGPDSTALLLLMARWRRALKRGPKLLAVTIDHGLRPTSAAEARAVKALARRLAVPHRTMRWEGKKPASGLQQAARDARYRLLAAAARSAKASAIITAHTLDDQAETVLLRLSRGSGLTGLSAMARESPLPGNGVVLVRPLLDIPKARLIAMLTRVKIRFADDPSNRDPRFTRVRLRELMPALAHEGLSARSLWRLAGRLRRADAAIETAVDEAMEKLCGSCPDHARIVVDADELVRLPAEVALRLLGRVIARAGAQGPIRLGKLEGLYEVLADMHANKTSRLRRTLAGALVTLSGSKLEVERAPPRRSQSPASMAGKQPRRTPASRARMAPRN